MLTDERFAKFRPILGEYKWLKGEIVDHESGLLFRGGSPVQGDLATMNLAIFDHDHLGWHTLTQVWDYLDENPSWQYVLILNTSDNDWKPRIVHSWGTKLPTFSEVAALIDEYFEYFKRLVPINF
jgi:hypothetical protein